VVFQRTHKATTQLNGVIQGRIERGQGFKVRLLKNGSLVGEKQVDSSLTFEFRDLAAGLYRLEVIGAEISQDNIRIDPGQEVVNINLAIPIPDDSVILGRVENGAGKTLLLIKEGNIISRFRIPVSGEYRFPDLAAGVYSLQLFESNIRQDNISLDGSNSREINLVVPVSQPEIADKTISHYLLFGPPGSRGRQTNLILAMDYMLAFSVTVGFSVEEAKQAQRVTIIGEGISAADRQAIQDSGSEVEAIAGDAYDIEAKLIARIKAGRAFGG
jgi:hypothetical protein